MSILFLTCTLTLILGIMFSKLFAPSNQQEYSHEWIKFQSDCQEDHAINQQIFEDNRFERNINREVNYRFEAYKERVEIDQKYPHFDVWQKYMMRTFDAGIRILNPMDFSQMIYHVPTAKYMNVNYSELIEEKLQEKIKSYDQTT